MIDKNSTNNQSYVVDVKILDVEKRYRPGPKHYVYVIQVTWTNPTNTFIIYRRYAQFFDLQCKLLDLLAEAPSPSNNFNTQNRLIPFLPGKIFLGRSQIRQVALERKHALNIYCQTLISLPERISRSRSVLDFFQTLPTDVQNPVEYLSNDKKSITNNAINISEPSRLPTYRCLDDFTAVEKSEMSLKRNTLVQVIQKQLNGWWFVQNGDRTGFVPGAFLKPVDQHDSHEINTSIKPSNESYVVNQSYEGKSREEISLKQGSFVTVLEKCYTGWWRVQFNNMSGQFPAVYLTSCQGRILPDNISKPEISNTSSNILTRRLSCLNDYEQNDNNQQPEKDFEPELYYVHSDYIDEVGDGVSLQKGDIVEIHEQHPSGWWYGRRLKDDFILTWIPSAFLQKEPIFDANIDKKSNESFSDSPIYLNFNNQESSSVDNMYQNTRLPTTSDVIYTEILPKQKSINQTVIAEQSSLALNDNEQGSTKLSVRDLVKKFNRQ